MPVSQFGHKRRALQEVQTGIHVFQPEYLGRKFSEFGPTRQWQWQKVAKQIRQQSEALQLKDPVFIYSHVEHMLPLCEEMKAKRFPLIHICMDYPEPWQYDLIAASDLTLVIPTGVFHKLKARYGGKIQRIPQSIHLPFAGRMADSQDISPEVASIPHPRLGYLGPVFGRLNIPMIRSVLAAHPEWHFLCFGVTDAMKLPNVHSLPWQEPVNLGRYVALFDVGVMPYDCFTEKNLHCAPLKVFDYFLAGLPVVSTPVIPLWEFEDLIYFGETAEEFACAIRRALAEAPEDPKRKMRIEAAHAHSTEALAKRFQELDILSDAGARSAN
jgi:Glycosyl transferases group 1